MGRAERMGIEVGTGGMDGRGCLRIDTGGVEAERVAVEANEVVEGGGDRGEARGVGLRDVDGGLGNCDTIWGEMGGTSGHSSGCLDDEPERSGEEAKPAVEAVNFGRLEPPAANEEEAEEKLSCMGEGSLELG